MCSVPQTSFFDSQFRFKTTWGLQGMFKHLCIFLTLIRVSRGCFRLAQCGYNQLLFRFECLLAAHNGSFARTACSSIPMKMIAQHRQTMRQTHMPRNRSDQ
jgi:hypothetical protein